MYGFLLIYIICGGTRRRRAFVRNTVYIYIYIIIHHSLLLLRFQSTQRRSSFLFIFTTLSSVCCGPWITTRIRHTHTSYTQHSKSVPVCLPAPPLVYTLLHRKQGKARQHPTASRRKVPKLFTTTTSTRDGKPVDKHIQTNVDRWWSRHLKVFQANGARFYIYIICKYLQGAQSLCLIVSTRFSQEE